MQQNEKTNPLVEQQHVKPQVLVVDDDPDVALFLAKALAHANYSVSTAHTCAEAIERVTSTNFDLLFTDINLPDAPGTDILKRVQQLNRSTSVILITGAPQIDAAVDAMKNGAFDYLSKPIDINKLHERAASALFHAQEQKKPIGEEAQQITNHGFNVIKTLGAGTMGTVLLVEQNNEQFAMKILRNSSESAISNHKLKRFIREAKILAKIDHPNVVKIVDYGIFKETKFPYILMEFLTGHPLSSYMQNVEMGLSEKISIIKQVASALVVVHDAGIIHRDVKPANIVITNEKIVKLTDFGIAHMMGSSLTVSREMLGSPAYMAPEAFNANERKDERADIFSLGVIAYELLTGQKPFGGDTIAEIMSQIRTAPPVEPLSLAPKMPPYLQDILAKMLAKDPEDRFASAAQVVRAFEHECASSLTREGITSRLLRTLLLKKPTWR